MFSNYQARKRINSYHYEISPNTHVKMKQDSNKNEHKKTNSRLNNQTHVIYSCEHFIFLFSGNDLLLMLFGNPP